MQYRITVPNVYDNFDILTTALGGVNAPATGAWSLTVFEDAHSADWHFMIVGRGESIRATFPTEARMTTPDRQISAIRDGIDRLICSLENSGNG